MYFILNLRKKLINEKFIDAYSVLTILLLISICFGMYMHFYEGLSTIDTFYYIVTTATTVGYGDISPQTYFGKIIAIPYMIISIASLGVILSIIGDKFYNLSKKIKKGLIKVKNSNLLIIGYPNEEKVYDIVTQLQSDKTFENKKITVIANNIKEKPEWMSSLGVKFIKGLGIDRSVLERADIMNVETALVLASNPMLIESDDSTSSTISVIERMNVNIRTIGERVRKDTLLFDSVGCDVITRVNSPEILAQEILDEGAIEIEQAIFSNITDGTQYNITFNNQDMFNILKNSHPTWADIAFLFIKANAIPEGYKFKESKNGFNLSPNAIDKIDKTVIIKYRCTKRLVKEDFVNI